MPGRPLSAIIFKHKFNGLWVFCGFLGNVIMRLRPIPTLFQSPAINNIANQKQIFRAGMFQKMQKLCGASAGCAEMRVRNPDASVILKPGNLFVHKSDLTVAQPAYVLIEVFCGNVSD
jgi:hypothetical protein